MAHPEQSEHAGEAPPPRTVGRSGRLSPRTGGRRGVLGPRTVARGGVVRD